MNTKLNYNNVVVELKNRMPEFKGYDHLIDNKIVYFTFFIDFLIDNFSNEVIFNKAALFINDMVDSCDEGLEIILDDIFLNIYSSFNEHDTPTKKILSRLSPKAKSMYDNTVDMWLRGNSNP